MTCGRAATLLTVVLTLAGCSMSAGSDPTPEKGATVERHEPSAAELDALKQELGALDGVTAVTTFTHRAGTFGNGPGTNAILDSDATGKPELVAILEKAYRLTWFHADLATGSLIYVVQNPATGTLAGSDDLGFDTASIGPRELSARYGPAPTPAP